MPHSANVVRLEDYQAPPYTIDHVSLTFQLHPTATLVTAHLSVSPRPDKSANAPLFLHGEELELVGVRLNGERLSEDVYDAKACSFSLRHAPDEPFTLELVTRISPQTNTHLEGLYLSNGTYCTQCEAEGFRRITYFYDRPDVLSIYQVRIEAPVTYRHLLANGNLIEQGPLRRPADAQGDEPWHYAVWHDPFPKPSYLFAIVAGDLAVVEDMFVTRSGRRVALRIFVEHGKENRVAYAMDALKRSMKWDEDTFGREYDLDTFMIVAVSDFNMGAMENKGLNIFNDKFVLANPDTATDTDYALIEAVIAHEYFHNWSGNRVTCRDWFQLCLKEGLTVYRDQEFSSDMRSRPVKRIHDVRQLRALQFPEDSGPLAHPVRPEVYSEINNFYTATVYEKGAELCRMLETLVGREGFRRSLDLYFARHDGQAVTIENFLIAIEETCPVDLSQFIRWYKQAGTPSVVATYAYDETKKQMILAIEQSCPPTPGQPIKHPMHIPIRFGLVARDGSPATFEFVRDAKTHRVVGRAQSTLLELTERQHKFVFEGVQKDAIPSLLRGFSAPVHLRTNLTRDDYLVLLRHDDDPYNRWEAAQYLLMDHFVRLARTSRTHGGSFGKPDIHPGLIDALKASMMDESLEHAFRAQLLQFPTDAEIAREIGHDVDTDAIHAARQFLRGALATSLGELAETQYHSLTETGHYQTDAQSVGRRSYRNVLLSLMLAAKTDNARDLAIAHYQNATNMTDRFVMLTSITLALPETAEPLLEQFHERYAGDALVIDKWLSLQATTPHDGTLEKIQRLMSHPSFSLANPNRVRALVGAFAMNNVIQFNRRDGLGFKLVADVILALDGTNPQTASRLANNFRSWRALEKARRVHAKAQLERIAATEALSKDVADIVNRCLQ